MADKNRFEYEIIAQADLAAVDRAIAKQKEQLDLTKQQEQANA